MEFKPTTPNAVWVALATLHKENPQKEAFQAKEIASKIKELDIQSASDVTVSTHISSHCVANKPAQPDTHRKLVRVRQGWYRLFTKDDPFDESRMKGQIVPLTEMIPERFHDLIDWYYDDYVNRSHPNEDIPDEYPSPEESEGTLDYDEEDIQFASVNSDNTVQIPDKIARKLQLKSGDHLAFIQSGDKVILKKAKVKLEI